MIDPGSIVQPQFWLALGACTAAASVGIWAVVTLPAEGQGDNRDQVNDTNGPVFGPRIVWRPTKADVDGMPGPLVYIVRKRAPAGTPDRDRVKIGVAGSTDPGAAAARVRQWSTGTEYPLDYVALIPGGDDLEAALHRAFAKERLSGGQESREWFDLPEEDADQWMPIIESVVQEVMGFAPVG